MHFLQEGHWNRLGIRQSARSDKPWHGKLLEVSRICFVPEYHERTLIKLQSSVGRTCLLSANKIMSTTSKEKFNLSKLTFRVSFCLPGGVFALACLPGGVFALGKLDFLGHDGHCFWDSCRTLKRFKFSNSGSPIEPGSCRHDGRT